MMHSYSSEFVYQAQEKLANMFELACVYENVDIDVYANKFISSGVSHLLEILDPKHFYGMSPSELNAIILGIDSRSYDEQDSDATSEFWVGYVLAYAQWYLNVSFERILSKISASELLSLYFPYHEMDIMEIVEVIEKRIGENNKLKELRLKRNMTQNDLSYFSDVPIRNIKAYEQGKVDITKASVDTIYSLAKALNCTMEYLITR